MYFLRLCLAFLHMAFTALCLIPLVILRPLHRNNMHLAARTVARGSRRIFGVRYVIENPQYLTPQGPTVFIGNHQDTLDMFFATRIVQPGVVALGKKELLYITAVPQFLPIKQSLFEALFFYALQMSLPLMMGTK